MHVVFLETKLPVNKFSAGFSSFSIQRDDRSYADWNRVSSWLCIYSYGLIYTEVTLQTRVMSDEGLQFAPKLTQNNIADFI